MSLGDWDGESGDIPHCIDCGARVDSYKYGPPVGIFQCISCAIGEVLEKGEPEVRRCYCGVELTFPGPICESCEQKGVQATTYMAALDWAQPEKEKANEHQQRV